jgi:hypothetical protein
MPVLRLKAKDVRRVVETVGEARDDDPSAAAQYGTSRT